MNTININFKENENKYITIYKTIKDMIIKGKLKGNEKLPSKRTLANRLNVSNNTIMDAYNLLLDEQYIYSVTKSGYYVTDHKFFNKKNSVEKEEHKIASLYDFTSENIDASIFPYYTIRKITQDIMQDNPSVWLSKSNFQGDINLRNAIASYLYENKGMDVNNSNIVIVSSLEESLDIISKITSIKKIGLENPCYLKVYHYFKKKERVLFDVDSKGILLNKNEPLDLLYITPYNQFPSGIKMSNSRKKEVLSAPVKYIFEDDFDCDLTNNNKVMSTLYSYNNEKVIYHGSFSHTICPGLRISYLVLPTKLINKYKEAYKNSSSRISSLDQALVCKFLNEGYYFRNLSHIKKELQIKKDIISSYFKEHNIPFRASELSFFIPISNINEIKERAAKHKIKIKFLNDYLINKESNELIISYSSTDKNSIIKALDYLLKKA